MDPEKTVRLLTDLQHMKKLELEAPTKKSAILSAFFQFVIGVGVLSFAINLAPKLNHLVYLSLLVAFAVFLILLSAYTFFSYIFRERYIMLIEAMLSEKKDVGSFGSQTNN